MGSTEFTLAFSRLGSVLNFLLTAHIDAVFGLQWTLNVSLTALV